MQISNSTGDALKLLTYKRPEFAHEKEIRFVLEFRQDELDAMEAENWNNEQLTSRVIAPGPPRALAQGFRPTLISDPLIALRHMAYISAPTWHG